MRDIEGSSERIPLMTNQPHKKVLHVVIILALAGMLVLILWLTVFSRLGRESRHFYPPFWSYKAILNGSGKALIEDVGNIILFIPVGLVVGLFFGLKTRHAIFVGLLFSTLIECCQWFFWLGSFEFDDLLHNTIGAGIGAVIVQRTFLGKRLKEQIVDKKKSFLAFVAVTALIIAMGFGYQGLKWQEMKRLAAINNGKNGEVNLLILSPDPVYIGETDLNISYNSDGSVLIEGTSDTRAWIEIGKVRLPAGNYVFSNLSRDNIDGIELYLQYFDSAEGKFKRIRKGMASSGEMTLLFEDYQIVRCMLAISPRDNYNISICPVIYQVMRN